MNCEPALGDCIFAHDILGIIINRTIFIFWSSALHVDEASCRNIVAFMTRSGANLRIGILLGIDGWAPSCTSSICQYRIRSVGHRSAGNPIHLAALTQQLALLTSDISDNMITLPHEAPSQPNQNAKAESPGCLKAARYIGGCLLETSCPPEPGRASARASAGIGPCSTAHPALVVDAKS